MVRAVLVVLVSTLVGCNQLLDLKEVVARDGGTGSGACDTLAFDMLRYRAKVENTGAGFTWQSARDACQFDGYDLAVFNAGDNTELANEALGAPLPFWVGIDYGTTWSSIDGCAPDFSWASGEPAISAAGNCARKQTTGLHSDTCQRQVVNMAPINALCETPRPSARCLQLQTERDYVMVGGAMNHFQATDACSAIGRHLVEIDSSDELTYVVGHFPGQSFWLGATRAGTGFTSPTGCPQVFAWGPSDPDAGTCAAYVGAMQSYYCNDAGQSFGTICELNSTL